MSFHPARAIILAGGAGLSCWHPQLRGPKLFVPVAGDTVLGWQCRWLRSNGVREALVAWCGDEPGDLRPDLPASLHGVDICWRRELVRRGTAGALRDARDFVRGEPFVVLAQDLLPVDLDLRDLAGGEWSDETCMRVFVRPAEATPLHALSFDEQGSVRTFLRHHARDDRRCTAMSLDAWVVRPSTLEHVPAEGYFDLKEHLFPKLIEAGLRIEAVSTDAFACRLDGPADHLLAVGRLLARAEREDRAVGDAETHQYAPGIWCQEGARIAHTAQLIGPVLVESGAIVEDHALVVGPVQIGAGAVVERGARLRASIVLPHACVGAGANVEASIVGDHDKVGGGERMMGVVRCGWDSPIHDGAGLPWQFTVPREHGARRLNRALYAFTKRSFDVALAALALMVTVPLFALVALAVRLDSQGPVFFSQARCARFGRSFRIYKFRTMTVEAAAQHEQLLSASEREGPMFKLANDPRITRIGHFLRRTSLDELPQLLNILLGDMSFVGPRPLAMSEMQSAPQWRDLRLSVRPGLTGLWQLYARRSRSFNDWIEYDVAYVVGPRSIRSDIKILLSTALSLIGGDARGE